MFLQSWQEDAMTKRNLIALFVLALCFGIGACGGSPTAPTPAPTITQVTVAPQSTIVPAGTQRTFQVSDPEAKCVAVQGKLTQSGVNLEYVAPKDFGGIDEIRCDKTGAQAGVAHVTVSRPVIAEYSRPNGSTGGSVVLAYYVSGEFGYSRQLCSTSANTALSTWTCVRDLAPGVYYIAALDSQRGTVPDGISIWGKLITNYTSPNQIQELQGKQAARFEVTADYNVK